jgi:division protein CdvB (Snf7/Vps24/ESCRT-III family)
MPESQVDSLMQQVADEHGLEFESQMEDSIGHVKKKKQEEKKEEKQKGKTEEQLLEDRLNALQGFK